MQTLATPQPIIAAARPTSPAHAEPTPWLAAIVLGVVFFMTDHAFDTSRLDAFTQTADEMEVTAMGGNSLRQLSFLSLAGFGIYNLVRRGRSRWNPSYAMLGIVGALLTICALSVMWSGDVGMTLRRLIVLGCCVCGVAGLVKQYSARQLMQMAMMVSSVYLAIGILTEFALGTFRPWGSEYRFSGTLHPNTQSLNLGALCLSAFCLWRDSVGRRGWMLVLFFVALTFLFMTKSRTASAGTLFALGFLWFLSTSLRAKLLTAFVAVWFGASAGLFLLFVSSDAGDLVADTALMGRNDQAATLSERLPLWTELAEYVKRRPMLGYGFDSFWKTDRIDQMAEEMEWGIREAHCSYLEAILTIGLVGMGLLVTSTLFGLVLSTRRYLRTRESAYGFIAALLVFGLFDGMMESGMVSPIFVTFLAAAGVIHAACFARSNPTGFVSHRTSPIGS